ncbi:MAG: carboxypeptidase family protein [Marinicaulis sp.]|nr:carboxypeptidase family protein [Marinicaulis sp.]NNL89492.1 carboxypeptidase family protein [Marinicaulis sp.]
MIKITSDFDHGNIDCGTADDPGNIELRIKPDGKADFFQWFYYRVDGAEGYSLTMRIKNAAKASYLGGWKNYNAVTSTDGEKWTRVETSYADDVLTISDAPSADTVYYAYFAAYPTTRYREFMAETKKSAALEHAIIGQTLDGQDIDYFKFGEGEKQLWVIARQHPGETMGSWWMEGFLPALCDESNAAAGALRNFATVHIIPCMNLDGSARGHLRTNAAGIDLNRAWRNTTMDKSPEVYLVREKMRETGVDFFLDVHGDEAIANNFLDSAENVPSWTDEDAARFNHFSDLLLKESKDFQDKEGYPTPPPGNANLDIATNYVGETWRCLAMTLEMPFKDAKVNPKPDVGWSPERCRSFAREHLNVMAKYFG